MCCRGARVKRLCHRSCWSQPTAWPQAESGFNLRCGAQRMFSMRCTITGSCSTLFSFSIFRGFGRLIDSHVLIYRFISDGTEGNVRCKAEYERTRPCGADNACCVRQSRLCKIRLTPARMRHLTPQSVSMFTIPKICHYPVSSPSHARQLIPFWGPITSHCAHSSVLFQSGRLPMPGPINPRTNAHEPQSPGVST